MTRQILAFRRRIAAISYVRIFGCLLFLLTGSPGFAQQHPGKPDSSQVTSVPDPEEGSEASAKPRKERKPGTCHIVLIMPFELEKNFSDTGMTEMLVDPTSLPALHFYEGALLAADSLRHDSILVRIDPYDAPSDSASIARLLTHPKVKDADLVIGGFAPALANAAAAIAARHHIRLLLTQAVSPDVIRNRPDVSIALASTHTQCREMVNFMLRFFPGVNMVMVYRNVKREDELAAVFREQLRNSGIPVKLTEFNASKSTIDKLPALIDTTARNLVYIVSSDQAFVSPALAELENIGMYGIQVAGLPTWQQFEAIDFMGFSNLQVFVFENNFIDFSDAPCATIRSAFIDHYAVDPLPIGYIGYEAVLHAARNLQAEDEKERYNFAGWNGTGCNHFDFSGGADSGFENHHISVLRFRDYKLELLNRW